MSTSSRFLTVSRGTLIRLRRQLELVRRGKEVLEMRREQLVREIFRLIDKLKARLEVERGYIRALEEISKIRVYRGEQEFLSITGLVKRPIIDIRPVSIQGVPVPQAEIVSEPDVSLIRDPEYHKVLEQLWETFHKLIEIANAEIAVEKLGEQLAYINRVVNSLEKSIIPSLEESIRYIGERLEEEMIEEFVRLREYARRV